MIRKVIADAGVRYTFDVGGKPVTARLNVQNLFDKDQWIVIYTGGAISTATPRVVQLGLSVDL